jgi:release factor glutamine methyltransferase
VWRMTTNPPPGREQVRAGDWLRSARARLAAQAQEQDQNESGLAAQVLLARVLNQTRSWVIAHPEAVLEPEQQSRLEQLLREFLDGVPLPYLLGQWEFFGLEFEVTPAVLIPRPETELLVERALEWLRSHPARRRAADVGTGSGIIAACLVKHTPDITMLAADRSWQALQVARRNIRKVGGGQVLFVLGNLLTGVSGPFDLVCANLPYIPGASLAELAVARHEPLSALDGGEDGLKLIRTLIEDAPRWLAPGGLLLLEIQYNQGEAVRSLAQASLSGACVRVLHDLAGLPRVVEIEAII